MQSIRWFLGPYRGRVRANYNWDIINYDSFVIITASEYAYSPFSPGVNPYPDEFARFVGDMTVTVSNVSPHGPPYDENHGVAFVLNVGYDQPKFVAVDITVLDDTHKSEVDFTPPYTFPPEETVHPLEMPGSIVPEPEPPR